MNLNQLRAIATKYLSKKKLSEWFVDFAEKNRFPTIFTVSEVSCLANWNSNLSKILVSALAEIGTLAKDSDDMYSIKSADTTWTIQESQITKFLFDEPLLTAKDVVDTSEVFKKPGMIFSGQIPKWFDLLNSAEQKEILCYIHYQRSFLQRFYEPEIIISTLKSGFSGLEVVLGLSAKEPFELYDKLPNLLKLMAFCFTASNPTSNAAVCTYLKQKKILSVLDVGGGLGQIYDRGNLAEYPEIDYQLFEHKSLVKKIMEWRRELEKPGFFKVISGDFFKDESKTLFLPEQKFEVIILGWILHDWEDLNCEIIIRKCMNHLAPGGHILVLEKPKTPSQNNSYHFMMQLIAGGIERTIDEYIKLLIPFDLQFTSHMEITGERDILVFTHEIGVDG